MIGRPILKAADQTMTEATRATVPPHIPARMLNEYAYCPRLAYLEWVQGEWDDNRETVEGTHVHRRVGGTDPAKLKIHDRSVHLTSDRLGATAIVDLIEARGKRVRPVDYKRGKKPPVKEGAYEPERVQLCLQGLLLREHGYECHEGVLYFAASRQRVRVRFTSQLESRTLALLQSMREEFSRGVIPPPLEDSPKCPRCSLVRICMPDEVNFLKSGGKPRPLLVADRALHPLIVQEPGARVRLDGERLLVEVQGKTAAGARLTETSQIVLMGGASCTAAVVRECCNRGIPIAHMSGTGWFYGLTQGLPHKNVELRLAQFQAANDGRRALPVARALVSSKIRNGRVLLRRNGNPPKTVLSELTALARLAERARSAEDLLGIEGTAARVYFESFTTFLKGEAAEIGEFHFEERNKRPPRDRVNALLSYTYAVLTKDWTIALYLAGFDPLLGLYHRPRYGKPALALDLMEPFRPVLADSVVVGVLNNAEIKAADFMRTAGGVLLKPSARKRLLAAYERRLGLQIHHPVFKYRCTYRRIFDIQARLLGRYLLGDIPAYPSFEVR